MLRVYERLTSEGLLEMRHGEGTFVGDGVSKAQLNGQRAQFSDELRQIVRQSRMLGIDAPGLHALGLGLAGMAFRRRRT